MRTKPMRFAGTALLLNVSTGAAGSVRVEIQDGEGRAVPGYSLADCEPLVGDFIEKTVTWKHGKAPGNLADRPVRLRFALKDADLYSIRFR